MRPCFIRTESTELYKLTYFIEEQNIYKLRKLLFSSDKSY